MNGITITRIYYKHNMVVLSIEHCEYKFNIYSHKHSSNRAVIIIIVFMDFIRSTRENKTNTNLSFLVK